MAERAHVLGGLGAVTTGLGLVLLLVPGLVRAVGPLDTLIEAVASADPKLLMFVAGLGVTGYVVSAVRSAPAPEEAGSRSGPQRRFEAAGPSPPEEVTAQRRALAASTVDGSFEAAIENGGTALHNARAHLVTAATDAYAVAAGQSREVARKAVARGTWTEDSVAAMFLAEGDQPAPPTSARLSLWLTPRRERRRRIEATVAAIERLEEGR
jgi:hypothetical protein